MSKLIDLSGKKFGRWIVMGRAPKPVDSKSREAHWLCKCECGNTKVVAGYFLRNGISRSCGCLNLELSIERLAANVYKKHGLSNNSLYMTHSAMKERCYNANHEKYPIYGARGITVCDEWLNDFMSFYNWAIQSGYKKGLTIDRIDVNGNYCPENCRWADHSIQGFNRRIQSNNSTGHKGVSVVRKTGKYRAYIKKNNKQIHLGYYDTYEEAVIVREKAEKEYYE